MDPELFACRMELLKWASEQGCPYVDHRRVMRAAAKGARLGVLQWGVQSRGWELPDGTCEWAAAGGNQAVLKWAREQGRYSYLQRGGWWRTLASPAVGEGACLPMDRVDLHPRS
eukprot:jgi/Tetstr1/463800/TSEL_008615.t1